MRKRNHRRPLWIAAMAGIALLAVIQTSNPNGIKVAPSAIYQPATVSTLP